MCGAVNSAPSHLIFVEWKWASIYVYRKWPEKKRIRKLETENKGMWMNMESFVLYITTQQ